ncbi:MAG TPA: DUF192 domain-containing protein [Candidatus Saccharimonadales bacterium]|nr:DUF192 domain-containing protein [Candidatus Saccharimonadales bacterium]
MPNSEIARIEWAPKKQAVLLFIAVLAIIVGAFAAGPSNVRTLKIGPQRFDLEVAVTKEEQRRGLSGRRSLGRNQGMLFILRQGERPCFWMKGMQFPLDIIWTDKQHRVVHMESHLLPKTYPRTFCSPSNAAYVIELPAGSIELADIREDQLLQF